MFSMFLWILKLYVIILYGSFCNSFFLSTLGFRELCMLLYVATIYSVWQLQFSIVECATIYLVPVTGHVSLSELLLFHTVVWRTFLCSSPRARMQARCSPRGLYQPTLFSAVIRSRVAFHHYRHLVLSDFKRFSNLMGVKLYLIALNFHFPCNFRAFS